MRIMIFTSALSRQSPSNGANSLLRILTIWLAILFQCNLNAGAFAFQFQINNSMNVRMRTPSRTFRYMKMPTTKVIPQTATSAFALNGARTSASVSTCTRTRTELRMGIFDFFQSREDDFIKLDPSSESTIGPGPLILFYNIPHGIDDEELAAMIEDGAPIASRVKKEGNGNGKNGVAFERIYPLQVRDGIYSDKSVMEVLQMIDNGNSNGNGNGNGDPDPSSAPILYFSGISNSEMMQTYNIIAKEIYEETGGTANAACAKVVEPAFGKSFRQLVEEISGDHADAMTVKE